MPDIIGYKSILGAIEYTSSQDDEFFFRLYNGALWFGLYNYNGGQRGLSWFPTSYNLPGAGYYYVAATYDGLNVGTSASLFSQCTNEFKHLRQRGGLRYRFRFNF